MMQFLREVSGISAHSADLAAAPLLSPEQQSRFRAHQIRAILSLAPVMIIANLFNAVVIDLVFWSASDALFLALWSALLAGFALMWGFNWLKKRAEPPRERASRRGLRAMYVNATIFGAVWAAPLSMFGHVDESHRAVLISMAAGMIGGGALTLATIWRAALIYSLMIEVPTMFLLLSAGELSYLGLAAMTVSFTAIIARTVYERGQRFTAGFIANQNLREQSQVISLLLCEFEENGSDWLFEIDADRRLSRVSEPLARQIGKPAAELNGMPVENLFANRMAGERRRPHASAMALGRLFRDKKAFRDFVTPVTLGGEQRWWSLTAKPVFDDANMFTGYRGVGSDVTDAQRAEASMKHMASYDSLTALPNRTLLHMRLSRELERLRQDAGGFALHSLDLDRFKNVNDTLGHPTGDLLLVEVASRVSALLREGDIVARFGGDEFVVLQANVRAAPEAGILAARMVEAVSAPYEINNQRILIGASVGIALAPQNGDNGDDLLRNSDLALYRAKADGKGRHRFFAAEMDAAMQSRRVLEIDLREALENNRLEVYFQPLIDVSTGQISACEALVRWNHPERGYISPAEFIPLAEETGLVVALGEFVLRTACAEAAAWPRAIRIAVNLSAVQFRSGDLADQVKKVLAESGLPAHSLELEITESILIEDKDSVLATLSELRATGVRISLDDFGTGYSSLAYLSSFPFDKIKIDRSFVRNVASRADSAAIIRAITSLAGTLGMCTTAEGVESLDELDWLRDQGCGEVQGFLFSAPVPAHDLKLLLGFKKGPPTRTAREQADAA